jgi:hypothetical protein
MNSRCLPRWEDRRARKNPRSTRLLIQLRCATFLADSSRIPLDPYRKEEHLPSELIDGNALRRRRGTRTDEDCVNHVCELVACGMTCKAARDHVGVPAITWYYWRRDNVARTLEKYELAKMVRPPVRARQGLG